MRRFFANLRTRKKIFFTSLFSTLTVGLLLFAGIFYVVEADDRIHYISVFAELHETPRVLWMPTILEFEYEPEEVEELPPYPTLFSILTGKRIYEGYALRRPLAIVINNIRVSLPQSGITKADIVYEVLAEGDVTRFVAIYQSYIPEKIGSIRSARDYFIDFAFNHDAIFLFHGSSPSGLGRIHSTGITNISGGQFEGTVFWRDRSFPEWTGNTGQRSREHSAYTGREQILEHMYQRDIRGVIGENPAYGFNFGEIPSRIESLGRAHRVTVPFSPNYTRIFVFDEETGLYLAENPAGPHLDAETQEQVAIANVIIQLTTMQFIGDYAGRRNVRTIGDGHGVLITGGEHFPVRWSKESHTSPARWFFEDGSPMVLSPGQTWICVFQGTFEIE